MRPFDTSKQRLWVGEGRYRGSCRNTAANSGSDSYTTNDSDPMRPDNANAYTYGEFASSHSYTYAKLTSSHANADTSFESNTNTYGELATGFAYATGDAKASADSASSAVR